MKYKIKHRGDLKTLTSPGYNYVFNKKNGFFARWGKNFNDDPTHSIYGPELIDVEISTICENNCAYCYKGAKSVGKNMSLETYKKVLEKVNCSDQVVQVALGLGDIMTNQELFQIAAHTREQGIIPNITINGSKMTSQHYDDLVRYMGAVAVSAHDKDTCYNAVSELTQRGMAQVNIHHVIYSENIKDTFSVIDDIKTDVRLKNLNAIVFLSLKKRGRACSDKFTTLSQDNFNKIIDYAREKNIQFGLDSCTAHKYLNYIEKHPELESQKQVIEPCESFGIFSSYVDVNGVYFPCSFAPGEGNWKTGIDLLKTEDFLKEVWFSDKLNCDRKESLSRCRECILYQI